MLMSFLNQWGEAAYSTLSFFWMALWAFILGYILSSIIQVFVTRERMQRSMGEENLRSVSLGAFFGFLSSSCSFAALATTRALFMKGASFMSSIAFLLASTNLVIELGILISIFLGWQFLLGEYIGGILLILIAWVLVRLIQPRALIKQAREKMGPAETEEVSDASTSQRLLSTEEWKKVGAQFEMEWQMVWKDVTLGFTIAGIVAVFIPDAFFRSLFIGSGSGVEMDLLTLIYHSVIGPVAAFFTFIGSMGNIPLAALLFERGVSFAGVMAFIFSDLVVFPVLRINARYYGWKMSLFILGLLLCSLVVTSVLLHYGLAVFDVLPEPTGSFEQSRGQAFSWNYTTFLNIAFLALAGLLAYLAYRSNSSGHHQMASKGKITDLILKILAIASLCWLTIGVGLKIALG